MGIACVYTRASCGVEAPLVTVEVHLSNGLPAFNLVGLPETSVKEAKERVRSAIINAGFEFPMQRITVNLAPADLPKQGGRYDLPIAIGILAASNQVPQQALSQHEFVGELSLSAHVQPCTGLLPVIVASKKADRKLVMPIANRHEAELVDYQQVYFASQLAHISAYLHGQDKLPGIEPGAEWIHEQEECINTNCISDVIGQYQAKQALEITAAGGHNLLFLGPPGTGKTMLASRIMSLLPPLNYDEALEVASIHSVAGMNIKPNDFFKRPFRSPHHTSSSVSLVGGGSIPKPGEISLSHKGVLFLDEVAEFPRKVLDCLREPMETGEVIISRAAAKLRFLSQFQLVAALNPSPCGDAEKSRATPNEIKRYLGRLSGPFIDRFDLTIDVPKLPQGTLTQKQTNNETSASIAERVAKARTLQLQRAGVLNSQLNGKLLKQTGGFKLEDLEFLEKSVNQLGLSVRSYHRLQRVARTIADLRGETNVDRSHIAQALGYRAMDRLLNRLNQS
ncbi:YifB family Mg chelatase-like AAA ATPase [Shewanella sp. 202IG2-18]|uniref:YifB family Mg chelatase-like AAA ATPase n=1 Tax=Parashewanella hymeniacidonis TaxID=2807618 RepID=UPI00196086C2|nr:YifB family Mg chelatase-like AAA ATPase [Parashewanella hymeniacidonis]MBM7071590.1 YifB family Mg chelatase-like AAA ATPase [Parashewanella hymeniacidonis]